MRIHLTWLITLSICVHPAFLGCAGAKVITPEELVQQKACVDYLAAGDANSAETRCEICLEYNERSAECLNGMGMIRLSQGLEDKARDFFTKAAKEDQNFAQARNNLGVLEFQKGNYDLATYQFKRAVEIDPNYLDGRYNLALTYLRIGDERRAKAYQAENRSQRSKKKRLSDQKVYLNFSGSDRRYILDHYKKAEREYRKVFELHPTHIPAYRDMGVISTFRAELLETPEKRRNEVVNAEGYFGKCLELQINQEECLANLGHLYLADARYEAALYIHLKCLAVNPNNPICSSELQQAYQGTETKNASMKKYMRRLKKNPSDASGHYGFCALLFERGLTNYALDECNQAIALDKDQCGAYYEVANHFERVGLLQNAKDYCQGYLGCEHPVSRSKDDFCREILEKPLTQDEQQATPAPAASKQPEPIYRKYL